MIKLLTALAALTVAMPAAAGTAHDFDPANVSTSPSTLNSGCYETEERDQVCFFRVTDEIYSIGINDVNETAPEVITVDCNSGQYRGYGPLEKNVSEWYVNGFCESGRY